MTRNTKEKRFPIMELFGPTIQGEGIMSGTVTHFLRTGGCGLNCSWCDSLFAVTPKLIREHRTMMTSAQILDAINQLPAAPWITFTGGDPCLHKDLGGIIYTLNARDMMVAVETQGQLFPAWLKDADAVTFSPKPPSSGNKVDYEYMANEIMTMFGLQPQHRATRICIKVVVFDQVDFNYALDVYNSMPESMYDAFYFTAGTPMGYELEDEATPEEKAEYGARKTFDVIRSQQNLAKMILDITPTMHFNFKTHLGCQQHVLLWPTESKGV